MSKWEKALSEYLNKKEKDKVSNAMSEDNLLTRVGHAYDYLHQDEDKYVTLSKKWQDMYKRALDYYNNESHQSFYDTYSGTRNKTGYVADTGAWYSNLETLKTQNNADAEKLLAELDQYSRYYNADAVKYVRDLITKRKSSYDDMMTDAKKFSDHWGQWGTRQDYDNAVWENNFYSSIQAGDFDAAQTYLNGMYKDVSNLGGEDPAIIEKRTKKLKEYQDYFTQMKEYSDAEAQAKEYLEYDAAAGQAEIERMENAPYYVAWKEAFENVEDVKAQILFLEREIDREKNAYRKNELAKELEDLRQKMVRYESIMVEFDGAKYAEDLAAKKAYHDEAVGYQTENEKYQEWYGVMLPNTESYDVDFDKKSSYGAFFSDPQETEDSRLLYLYINNRDDYLDYVEQVGENVTPGAPRITFNEHTASRADAMSEDEKKLFNYYYNTQGAQKAMQFFDSLEEHLNYKVGEKIAADLEKYPVLQYLYSGVVGFDNFVQGMENIMTDEVRPTSALQYAGAAVREDLAEDNPQYYNIKTGQWEDIGIWYNFKTGKWENKVFGSSVGQVAFDLGSTISNQLPSIIVSAAIGTVSKTAGAAVGATLLGASVGGNAKQEMLKLGYSKDQANAYGLLVGASEAGLSYVLGGIPGLRGSDGVFSALGQKVLTKVDNALARAAITLGANMLDEGLEEGLQTVLEPWFKSVVTNADYEAPNIDEVLYSSLLGALSAAGFGAGEAVGVYQDAKQKYVSAKPNSDILSMIDNVSKGNFKPNDKVYLNNVSDDIAKQIYDLTGVDVKGFKVAIEARQIEHILKDHGKNGRSDRSMANPEDIAKIEHVLNSPDKLSKAGKTQAYSYMRDGKNRTADTVLYEKNIGEQSHYVVQAIPDTKAKTLYVVTTFIGKSGYEKGASQLINAQSPNATSEIGSANTPNGSISHDGGFVNSKNLTYLAQSAELADIGENGVQIMREIYDGSTDPVKFFEAYNRVYAAGKRSGQTRGRDVSLLGKNVSDMIYKAGQMDALKNGGTTVATVNTTTLKAELKKRENSQQGLQNGSQSGTISTENMEAQNEQELHLRDSGERNDSKNSRGQVSAVEGNARQNKGRGEGRTGSRDSEASSLSYDREVSAKSLVKGGLESSKVRIVAEGSETESMKEARKIAESRGLKAVFFGGGNLKVLKGSNIISARAYIQGDTVYVRVDHAGFAADQLMLHEAAHDMIDKDEINVKDVKKLIGERFTPEEIDAVINSYAIAYKDAGMTADKIWEEVICDSVAEMNSFEGTDFTAAAEMAADFLPDLKEAVLESKKESRGPPKNTESKGHASYAGENAGTADTMSLSDAKEMLAAGVDSETIRKETGWFTSYDSKWRFEIDDSTAIWHLDTAKPDPSRLFNFGERIFKLSDILDHPALYKAYPQLKNVTVWENPNSTVSGYVVGRSTDAITMQSLKNTELNKDLIIHEIQHLIQNIEGFAPGASVTQFDYKAWGDREYAAYEKRNEIASKLYAILRRHGVSIKKTDVYAVRTAFEIRDSIIDYNFMLIESLADNNERTRALLDEYYKQVQILNLTTPEGQYHAVPGEIEAHDAQARRRQTSEERKNTRPNIDREDVVFAEDVSYHQASSIEDDEDVRSIRQQLEKSKDILATITPIQSKYSPRKFKNAKEALDWAVNVLKSSGQLIQRQGYGDVVLDEKRLKNGLSYLKTDAEKVAFSLIPKVIKNGIEVGRHQKHKGRNYDTVTFALPVTIGDNTGYMAVVIREEGKKYFKLHRVLMPDHGLFKFTETKKSNAETAGLQNANVSPTNVASNISIPQKSDLSTPSAKKVSKDDGHASIDLASMDADYMSAVESGDMKTAQRMVDEAAREAGYDDDAYHGTNQGDFNKFEWNKTQRADGGFFGRGHYFTKSEGMAKLYGKRIVKAKLKLGKTFVWSEEINSYKGKRPPELLSRNIVSRINMAKMFPDIFANQTMSYWEYDTNKGENVEKTIKWDELEDIVNDLSKGLTLRAYADGTYKWHTEGRFWEVPVGESYSSAVEANEGKFFAAINALKEKYDGLLSSMSFDDQTTYTQQYGTEITEALKKMGYSSAMDTTEGSEIVVFDSNQIKSADPVTYDDNGNVIPLSERFNSENADIRFSLDLGEMVEDTETKPEPRELSSREILANMLESVAETDRDKSILNRYKDHLAKIENNRAEIERLKEERRKAEKAKQKKAISQKIEKLQGEIDYSEKRLITLEDTTTLKYLVSKERKARQAEAHLAGQMAQGRRDAEILRHANEKLAEQKTAYGEKLAEQKKSAREALEEQAKRYQESRAKSVEGRRKTDMKHKIQRVVAELDTLLRKGNKKSNVKLGLQDAVAAALEAFDINSEKAERYAKEVARLDAKIAAATDPDEIEALMALREKKRRNSEMLADKLAAMKKAYEDIHKNAGDENYPAYYRAEAKVIQDRISDVLEKVGNVPISEMSLDQLDAVYDMYRMVLTTVRDANKAFINGQLEDLAENAADMTAELQKIKKLPEERLRAGDNARRKVWNELTPYYAFKRIGSETLMRYYDELVRGQDVYARDLDEAKRFAEKVREKYKADKWNRNKIVTFKDKDGRTFRLNLGHMMSIYAYSKREQAFDHMEKGGFFFNNKEVFRKDEKTGLFDFIISNESGYKVDAAVFAKIKAALTPAQIAYVDEMQAYLTEMGAKGNEVTRIMWGIDIFKENVYFPLKSKEDFVYQANTPAETSSLKNDGMTKETKPHASNPIVLESFDDVWANHVNKMSTYHGFVIPIDNLNKLINYGSWMDGEAQAISTMLEARYSSAVNDYLTTFIKDLNGAKAQNGELLGIMSNWLTKFKKTSVAASLSVIVQQPTAILRATSEIDARYFANLPKVESLNKKWDKIQKYAPIAIIKDIGGFDAGSGRQITEWLNADTHQGVRKVMNKIDDVTMYGAALGDRVGWGAIWTAVEREVRAKQGLKYGTEEYFQACGKRFTEVIVKTQVYDSTLSRSGFMRGKDGLLKMATAFMGEPTLSINMLADTFLQAKRGTIKKRQAVRTVAAVYSATVAASIIKSIIYALRDDDEDESYAEKYLQALGGTILNDVNPLSMLPFYRDVVSILDGWEVERTDMAIVQDLYNAITALDSENKTTWRKIEDLAGALGALAGVPAKNLLRTAREMYNAINDTFDGIEGGDLGGAFMEGITGKEKSKSQTLYEALIGGESERIAAIRKNYTSDKEYNEAIRKALRDYDPRIKKAAQALYEGDLITRNEIMLEIMKEGVFDKETLDRAIDAEMQAIKNAEKDSSEEEKESEWTSVYSPSDIPSAFDYCSDQLALEIIAELTGIKVEDKVEAAKAKADAQGKKFDEAEAREEAEDEVRTTLRSTLTKHYKPLYYSAYLKGDSKEMERIRNILITSELYVYKTKKDVDDVLEEWIESYDED